MSHALEVLYGVHAVHEALRAGRREIAAVWYARRREDGSFTEILGLAKARNIPLRLVDPAALERLCRHPHHQGIIAQVSPFSYRAFDQSLVVGESGTGPPCVVLLDQIQDPQNTGAIIRTAYGCGVRAVVLTKEHAAKVTPAVSRASAGAAEWLPIAQVANLNMAMKGLKAWNLWVVGLSLQGERSIYQHDFRGGLALVLGSEGQGLRRLVSAHCDSLLHIPIQGAVGSYNVSATAALVLGEVMRSRR